MTAKNVNGVSVIAAKRTPIGSFRGQFAHLRAPELAGKLMVDIFHHQTIHRLIEQPGIDECILGCVLSAGVGQAPARQAIFAAHLPESIPCSMVNKVCGSGMKAVTMGFDSIRAEQAKIVIAGGMESMSRAPFLLERAPQADKNVKPLAKTGAVKEPLLEHPKVVDHLLFDGLENFYDGFLMGHFAELLVNRDPQKYDRESQDLFAMASLEKAKFATLMKRFEHEMTSIEGITSDERVEKSHVEKIPRLKPAFHRNGSITAANSSSLSDGAAVLLLAESSLIEIYDLPCLAHILGYSHHAMSPDQFPLAPIGAIKKLLNQLEWSMDDVDLFEINEAFAITTMVTIDELGIPPDKVNINGGACALGHPIGASGSRIIVSLIHALKHESGQRGIASICIGGGEAMAIALEIC